MLILKEKERSQVKNLNLHVKQEGKEQTKPNLRNSYKIDNKIDAKKALCPTHQNKYISLLLIPTIS